MGLPSVFQTGKSGMMAARAAISTAGHNVANAGTEGYSRQRVQTATQPGVNTVGHNLVGGGTTIQRIERVNDEYLEKQLRDAGRDMANLEEKDTVLRQVEDVFNEMGGDGINRLLSRFFNEFRKLGNDPDNEAVRESVREASRALVSDFRRQRKEIEDVSKHIDARVEGYSREASSLAAELKDLNNRIRTHEISRTPPNDLMDKRDQALRKLAELMDISAHKDNHGNVCVDIRGVGPLVTGGQNESLSSERSPADLLDGKPEGAVDIRSTASAASDITHAIKGGKLGGLIEVRDQILGRVLSRMDDMAYTLAESVNAIHREGFTRNGATGVDFFKVPPQRERAAEFLELSEAVTRNANFIASAAMPEAPGDNRIALAISSLQGLRLMNEGRSTIDDYFNSVVSDVGIMAGSNRSGINQQKDIVQQLGKIREQISGVSIDEETANLMQFQHAFDASARVIKIADEMLDEVLRLR